MFLWEKMGDNMSDDDDDGDDDDDDTSKVLLNCRWDDASIGSTLTYVGRV